MNIVYIGTGFVGACSAAVSADSGHSVFAFDINRDKIASLNSQDPNIITACLHEDGLADLIIQHKSRLKFSASKEELQAQLDTADAVFMCLPTPEKPNGASDLSAFENASEMLGDMLVQRNSGQQSKRVLIVNKSTVPIHTVDLTRNILHGKSANNFGVASNPEFLVEGQAVHDSIHPKRVIVGAESPEDFDTLRRIYQRFYSSPNVQYIEMNPYEAACAKLLSNTALFTKLAFTYSTAGRICELFPDVSYEKIRQGVSSDNRIGQWGFYDSLYAGGSCLIKDAQSLAYQIEQHGGNADFIHAILSANEYQIAHFIERAEKEARYSWSGKTVAILGLAFKQGTNDIRHSGSLLAIKALLGSGVAGINAFDPAANTTCAGYFNADENPLYAKIHYKNSVHEALENTDCVIISTDWPEFRVAGDEIMKMCKAPYLIMDGRRMLVERYQEMVGAGFTIIAVGSPLLGKKL